MVISSRQTTFGCNWFFHFLTEKLTLFLTFEVVKFFVCGHLSTIHKRQI